MDRMDFNYGWIVICVLAFSTSCSPFRFTFPPDDCLPMSDPSYDAYRHKGMKKEIVENFTGAYSRKLYCYDGCCGDGTNNGLQCCLPTDEESGMDTLKMVTIIAAGIVGLLLVVISLVHYVKAHNKKKRLIADIKSLQQSGKSKKNKKTKRIKVGEYQRDKMNRGNPLQQGQWNQAPQGNVFVTKPSLPSIPVAPKPQATNRDPSDFTAIVPTAGDSMYYNGESRGSQPVPPPAQYNPDQEVLKSIIANLPGPKIMPANGNNSGHAFYGRY